MIPCVPEWDVASNELDVAMDSTDWLSPAKDKWESAQEKRLNASDMSFVPENGFEELCWDDGQLLVIMQGQSSKGPKQRSWPASSPSQIPAAAETKDAAVFSRPRAPDKDCTLEAVVRDVGGMDCSAVGNNYLQDDEMISWLYSSLDESLGKFCPDMSDIPNSNVQTRKENKDQDAIYFGQPMHVPTSVGNFEPACTAAIPVSRGFDKVTKQMNDNTGVDVDSGRVTGLVPQTTGQPFCKMGSPGQQFSLAKQVNVPVCASSSKGFSTDFSASPLTKASKGSGSMMASSQMPPPKVQPAAARTLGSSHLGRTGLMNFSHFSRPAAAIKADLCTIGMGSGPTGTERLKQLDMVAVEVCMSTESSIESTTTGSSPLGTMGERNSLLAATDGPQSMCNTSMWHPVQSLSSRKEADPALCSDDAADCSVKAIDPPNGWKTCVTSNVALRTEKGSQVHENPEPTVTSSSGGSGSSGGKVQNIPGGCGKRNARDIDDSEGQSEDPEEESADGKKSFPDRSTSSKRSRAAQNHNQSERRRRDRINEKMKALQQLIPNSNKSDKASLLEEAIEYLKLLQTQLQVMSVRSGMGISPILIPPGMQHLQMAQMAPLPHMGMGMNMGMGMGVVDMGVASSARHVMPLGPLSGSVVPGYGIPAVPCATLPGYAASGPSLPGTTLSMPAVPKPGSHGHPPTLAMAAGNSHDLHNSHGMGYNGYFPHQMQISSQPMNVTMFNALMTQHHHRSQQSNCKLGSAPT